MTLFRKLEVFFIVLFTWGCAAKNNPDMAGGASEYQELNPVVIEEEIELDQKAKNFDIPIVVNERVEAFIRYFQGPGKAVFTRWLLRSRRYIPMMRQVLRQHGLPEDLVYLAMIESGFSPNAFSRARASGPWQFMYQTGKRYDLRVDEWIDERNDPEKSTVAAARHLKDLYDELQDWYLAAASYNAGINKVKRAMERYRTEDFWQMVKRGRILKPETKNYVPKMIAAALIAKDPESYGFSSLEYEQAVATVKIPLYKPTDLRLLAERASYSYEELKRLNPELRRFCTPPNVVPYELRVPSDSRKNFEVADKSIGDQERLRFKAYQIRRGDTLSTVAARYRVPVSEIVKFNRIRSTRRLRPGTVIILPLPYDVAERKEESRAASLRKSRLAAKLLEIRHVVRAGESINSVATKYGVRTSEVKRWNGLTRSRIFIGQTLEIHLRVQAAAGRKSPVAQAESPKSKVIRYRIRRGDTLWGIAKKYDVDVETILTVNDLERDAHLIPGNRIKIPI